MMQANGYKKVIVLSGLCSVMWLGGCALDSQRSSYNNYDYNNYPYNTSYSSRYPSNGYETEYRKAQKTINSQDRQAIINGITQRMLSGGWYPESIQGNQLLFTKVRNTDDQRVYYKTVYTLIPNANSYVVYASMKLKTMDSPYRGSLDEAAHKVDDKTESILKNVKKEVEQASVTTPVPMVQKLFTDPQAAQPYNQPQQVPSDPLSTPVISVPTSLPTKTIVEPYIDKPFTNTVNATPVPVKTFPAEEQERVEKQHNKQNEFDEYKEQLEKTKNEKRNKQDDEASNKKKNKQEDEKVTPEPAAVQ